MSAEADEAWSEEQIEAWQHNRWLLMQELGDDYYKIHERTDQDSEEDPFEEEERMRWQEEEEEAMAEYFKMIEEEEKRGYYRKTVAHMIEEESTANKKKKEIERKKKTEENEKVPDKGKEEDRESIKPEESLSPVDDVGAKDAGEEASDPTDSFHPKEGYSTSVQETGLQDLTLKESDGEARGFVESSKEVDVEAEKGSTGQVTGHQFKKESSGKEDEVDSAKKQMPRACKWLS